MRTNNNNLSHRKILIMGIFIAVGALFLIRLFSLQVLDKHYKELADNNALRFVTQYPARGKVFDRNGQLLVFNEAVYDLMVIPKQAMKKDTLNPFDTLTFCALLDIDKESFVERMNKAKKAFVEQLAGYVQKYAPEYGISVCSPIIAQGILESAWGKSKLS